MVKIIELSCVDTSALLDPVAFCIGLVFSGAVEPGKIEQAWRTLGKAWPILGAHARRNEQTNKVEMVVPDAANLELKASSLTVNQTLAETEPLFIRTSAISTQVTARSANLYRPRSPQGLQDLIMSGDAIWSLHVTYLKDATIIAPTFPHVMDGKGYETIIKGLRMALEGQPIPPLLSSDPWSIILPKALSSPTPKAGAVWDVDSIQAMQQAMMLDLQATGPVQTRTIYFPAVEIRRLKQQAMDEIRKAGHNDVKQLSTSDVLSAWFYQHAFVDLPDSEIKTRFVHPVNSRKHFPEAFPPDYSYIRNSIFVASADPLTVAQLHSLAFGEIARVVHLSVIGHSAREPMMSILKGNYNHQGQLYLPFGPGECIRLITSWLVFEIGDIAKYVKPGTGTGQLLDMSGETIGAPPGTALIKFKDADGGVVCEMDLGTKCWTSGGMAKYALEMQKQPPSSSRQFVLRARL